MPATRSHSFPLSVTSPRALAALLLLCLVACAGPTGYAGGAPRAGTLRYAPGGSFRSSRPLSPEEEARWKAIEAKLEEYLQWGMLLMQTHASHLRRIAPGHLLTEHPLREKSLDALVRATLAWAYSHTQDPDFLRRSPSEVALYLLASRSSLATAIELGKRAPPHLDYTSPAEDSYTQAELVAELAIGLTPLVGDVSDLAAALSGKSLTGHPLSDTERLIHVLGVVLPFAHGKLLKQGGEAALQRVALVTGRSLDEVRVLSRVASQLSTQDVKEIEHILQRAADRGGTLADEELAFLQKVAGKLEKPLDEAAEALRRGEKLPLMGARTLSNGARMLPGSAEHLAQCWVDYQFRHPHKYPRFSFAVDPEWERLYRSILANKPAGSAFEDSILKAASLEKNTALMMPPPGSQTMGFIPDSVRGNPGELLWGQPYRFVEAKGRQELALTGNLKAMLDYVRDHGGHVELWVRSARHPAGETRLTEPLLRYLNDLASSGKASVKSFP